MSESSHDRSSRHLATHFATRPLLAAALVASCLSLGAVTPRATQQPPDAPLRPAAAGTPASTDNGDHGAEIRRDRFGVPHILAKTESAAAFAHGYVTAEDHGAALARLFLRAQGRLASVFGEQVADEDVRARLLGIHEVASKRFTELPPYMQGILNSYAAGYNAFLTRHRGEFPEWAAAVTGVDVLAHARAVLLLDFALDLSQLWSDIRQSAGSNMWAVGRGLSKSGHGMLLANPHVPWQGSTLFHEVQLTVPGVINVSGATMIGLPVVTIGFNESLGWSHTVNRIDADDVYELTLDADGTHYSYDGRWLPLEPRTVSIEIRTGSGVQTRTQTVSSSHYGPVVRTDGAKAYALKSANLDDVNFLTEWNAMGKASSLRTFTAAVNMQQLPMFNLGYADRDGNVWYVFNGRIPLRPEGYNWAGVVPGNSSKTEWFVVRSLGDLPQLLNPISGYIQNCNDPPWFTNLEQPIARTPFSDYINDDGLNWRSQLSLRILSTQHELTLEQLKAYKYNAEMPFASRVKDDLVALVKAQQNPEWQEAVRVLEGWDNRADAESRGAVLFNTWWNAYSQLVSAPFRVPWSAADPIHTPTGLADSRRALEAFTRATARVMQAYGSVDIPWGETHRLKRGDLDLPIGGAPQAFQSIQYRAAADNKFVASGGDSYVLAVEFLPDGPHAFTVMAYSEASNPRSPHVQDQTRLYANRQYKPAWFTEADIAANLSRQYRPDQ